MYNRYIPQPDGSYRRNPVQEQRHVQRQTQKPSPPPPPPPAPRQMSTEPIPGFLRQLLPKSFDTGDLIILLLLLLIAGDSQEHRNQALLTLALYFVL